MDEVEEVGDEEGMESVLSEELGDKWGREFELSKIEGNAGVLG